MARAIKYRNRVLSRTVDAIEMRQVDIDGAILRQIRRQLLNGTCDQLEVSEVERTRRHQASVIALAVDADAHRRRVLSGFHALSRQPGGTRDMA